MKVCLIVEDNAIGKDGDFIHYDYSSNIASNISAVQFETDTNTGHIEYNDGTPNLDITSLPADVQALVDSHATKKVEIAEEIQNAENTRDVDIDELREIRNHMLIESDWTHTTDSPLSDSDKTAWATYRQELRDMTNDYTTTQYNLITFPTKP